jgi:hypothetical protein
MLMRLLPLLLPWQSAVRLYNGLCILHMLDVRLSVLYGARRWCKLDLLNLLAYNAYLPTYLP